MHLNHILITIINFHLIIGSTFAVLYVAYWMQLSERLGPIMINLSRVVSDVTTIMCNYLIILVAFSLGILFVSKIDQSVSSFPKMNHTRIIQENMIGYKKIQTILKTLFWSSLNPGPDTETFPEEDFTGYLTNILFGIYQIFVIIMLLNLLIAMMNSTMQKIQDKRSLYWKFERTSTMMDFINEYYVVPPPFLILHVILYLVFLFLFGLMYGVWLLYKKISKENKRIS